MKKIMMIIGVTILTLTSCKKEELDLVYECRGIKEEMEAERTELLSLTNAYNEGTNSVTIDMINEMQAELQISEELYKDCLNGEFH